jgi:predicted nucleic acid-binding protein
MAVSAIVDAGYLIALLGRRDHYRDWAAMQAEHFPPPWNTCEPVLSETFHMLGEEGAGSLISLLRRRMLRPAIAFNENADAVLDLMEKYRQVPMSFADACLVRMTELLNGAVLLTTDSDFRIYRRHSRQIVPCVMPS